MSIHPVRTSATAGHHSEGLKPSFETAGRNFFKDTIQPQKQHASQGNSFFGAIGNCLKKIWNWIVSIFTCSCFKKDQSVSSTTQTQPVPKTDQRLQARIQEVKQLAQKYEKLDFYDDKTTPITAFLGNFEPCRIEVTGGANTWVFPNAEANFQAQKFWSKKHIVQQFTQCATGDDAFKLSRKYAGQEDNNKAWHSGGLNSGKENAMRRALNSKFRQNEHLKQLLIATYPAKLNEHNPVKGRDNYWSDDCDGTGQNRLGKLLEELRQTFMQEAIS